MKNSPNDLIPVLLEAGTLLREHFEGRHLSGEEEGLGGEGPVTLKAEHELVLGVDILSQKILVDGIRRLFPDYGVYSEEMTNWNEFDADRRMKFVIDPLDGTHNYHFGIPQWGIAVSLLDGSNRPRAGFIHIPMLGLLLANDGSSSDATVLHYQGKVTPARTSSRTRLDKALVAYDNQFYRLGREAFETYGRLTQSAFTTRITGSAAFDTVMVALGKFDARLWNKVEIYDIAAGFPIIRGAGGVVCAFDGNADIGVSHGRIMICASAEFASALAPLLNPGAKRAG